jgi:hypothetical protein
MSELQPYSDPFLPEKSEALSRFGGFKPKKLPPLKPEDKSELQTLVASEEQRENDILIYGAALDEVELLLLPKENLKITIAEKLSKKITNEIKIRTILQHIKAGVERELEMTGQAIMEAKNKEKIINQLNDYLSQIDSANIKPNLTDVQAVNYLLKFFKPIALRDLRAIFKNKFDKLYEDRRRFSDLSNRAKAKDFG